MQGFISIHGLCQQCILKGGNIQLTKKSKFCLNCGKKPNLLFNMQPYCHICYLQIISSPNKSQLNSQKQNKNKCYYKSIDRQQIKNIKKSFFADNGKIIKKIIKIFDQNSNQILLNNFLNKKALNLFNSQSEKILQKINKNSNLVYIFIGKKKIVGAFHCHPVIVDQQTVIRDQQAGIFITNKQNFDIQFARVKSDAVKYNFKKKSIIFGIPSSLQISFQKQIKLNTQLSEQFQTMSAFLYKI